MHSLLFGSEFLASVKKLDAHLKERVQQQLELLQQDVFSAKLHTKPLHGKLAGFYSLRVGRDYRIIFQFRDGQEIVLLDIKPRDKIYR